MTAAKRYLKKIEHWDKIAEDGEFASDWGGDLATAPNIYLIQCIDKGVAPSFRGFMSYISTIAPSDTESERTK